MLIAAVFGEAQRSINAGSQTNSSLTNAAGDDSIKTGVTIDEPPVVSRVYICQCGRPVFVRDSHLLHCDAAFGYVAATHQVIPLSSGKVAGD